MKYAIVESGGKQYKAVEGRTIEVDRLQVEVGKKVELGDVYLVSDEGEIEVGTPKVSGAKVTATVREHFLGPKLIIFKYRPKQRYRVKTGHRQQYTRLMVETIAGKGGKVTARKAEPAPEPKAEKMAAPAAETAAKAKPAPKTKTAARPKTAAKTAAKTPASKGGAKKTTKTGGKKTGAKKKTAK
jgi:large subunit ribosomal protein L21